MVSDVSTSPARSQARSTGPQGSSLLSRKTRAYVALTKPRVIELLLVTTAPVMILAHGGIPSLWLIMWTLVGGALSAGSANAYNMVIDRDIDAHMGRTNNRPLVTGEVSAKEAIVFATILAVGSVALLWWATNWLAAMLSLAAIMFYVFVYTMWLKRRSEQNIIWGGIAGCFPVLIGWAAVTGSLAWEPVILFLVVFLWTPPHYWPLSMKYRDDYAGVNVPMLAVVRPAPIVGVQIILYAWATVAASLMLIPVAPMGWLYTIVALGAGAWFLIESHKLFGRVVKAEPIDPKPMRVFHSSISYLTLLFIAVGVDPLLPW